MHATAAATQAGVTVRTVRSWCRRGVVTATKAAGGRWSIEETSLARRITIGTWKKATRVTEQQPRYGIEQTTIEQYGRTRTVYRIVRTDGTPAGYGPNRDRRIALNLNPFPTWEKAEEMRKFIEGTPEGYRLERHLYRAGSMNRGAYWVLGGCIEGDPTEVRHPWDEGKPVSDSWPEGTTWIDVMIHLANRHAADAPARIAQKAEQDAIDAAEAAVREAREQQLEQARREKGTLATERQVEYIMQLLARRAHTGEGGGFFYGPTNRADIELMSKADASLYITSLKGDY